MRAGNYALTTVAALLGEGSAMKIIVAAAVVLFALLVFSVFWRRGWKKKKR
jgi:hypothetical protein